MLPAAEGLAQGHSARKLPGLKLRSDGFQVPNAPFCGTHCITLNHTPLQEHPNPPPFGGQDSSYRTGLLTLGPLTCEGVPDAAQTHHSSLHTAGPRAGPRRKTLLRCWARQGVGPSHWCRPRSCRVARGARCGPAAARKKSAAQGHHALDSPRGPGKPWAGGSGGSGSGRPVGSRQSVLSVGQPVPGQPMRTPAAAPASA